MKSTVKQKKYAIDAINEKFKIEMDNIIYASPKKPKSKRADYLKKKHETPKRSKKLKL